MIDALAAVCVALLSGLFGAGVAVSVLALSKHGEAARFDVAMQPVRSALEDLEDRIDHVRKRAYKRDRDERAEREPRPGQAGLPLYGRAAKLAAVRERVRNGGLVSQPEEGPQEAR